MHVGTHFAEWERTIQGFVVRKAPEVTVAGECCCPVLSGGTPVGDADLSRLNGPTALVLFGGTLPDAIFTASLFQDIFNSSELHVFIVLCLEIEKSAKILVLF